jgi:hypothetical protein
MTWAEQRGDLVVSLVTAGSFYLGITWLFRSLNPAGKLSWQGRRFRNGGTLFLLLFFGGLEITALRQEDNVGTLAAAALYSGLGLLLLLLVRWWWQDRQKEEAARAALVEKLHQEGRELAAPPMSTGKKAWRWVVNGYAIFLVAAGLYALIRYLLKH